MSDGASNNERLLSAARDDNEDLILEIFEEPDTFDINFKDGTGSTALHYAVKNGSLTVLEHILEHEECDVDPIDRLEGATPLHYAVRLEDEDIRRQVVESLLDAGADTSMRDRRGSKAEDLIPGADDTTRQLFKNARATTAIADGDIAHDDSDDEPGSGSESE